MTELFWSLDELARHTRSDESEVRFWAIDRLIRHFPGECCDAIHEFLLDDHDATPTLVARHLGEYGSARHHNILLRGFRLLRGLTPGHCLQALTRLGYPEAIDLARTAFQRGDLTAPALAIVAEAMAEHDTDEARELVREMVDRRPELLSEPTALRAALRVVPADALHSLLNRYIALSSRGGSDRAGEAFRVLMDELRIDDVSWCLRTGPAGHIELRKTIKAVESGYDCEVMSVLGETLVNRLSQRLRAGAPATVISELADWTGEATARMRVEPGSELPVRIDAAVRGLASPQNLSEAERLGTQFTEWVLGFQLSAAIAVARSGSREWSFRQAHKVLGRLLELAEIESAFHLGELPAAIVEACGGDRAQSDRAQDWCLRMLEAQGPFFPKVVALETLGELRAVHFIPEVMDYLSEENSYIYGAAERALSRMGEAIVPSAVQRIDSGQLDPDGAHSLLVLLCDLGTGTAYDVLVRHLDWFMDTVGPGTTAEWVSLFGTEELIDPLRDWLEQDPALVGQALLLLGAINNVTIPEEDEILRAIEAERARQEADGDDGELSASYDDGDYVM